MERILGQLAGETEVTVRPDASTPRDLYKLLIGAVIPRPIAFVSSLSAAGVPNLAPFSFFTVVSANPPTVCFCPMVDSTGKTKDTLDNIRATQEFVVNVVSEEFLDQMNRCSAQFPPEVDEFTESGLTPIASETIRPARVAESYVQMECVLNRIVDVSTLPLGGSIVLGEVKLFHVAEAVLQNGTIDPAKLHAIGRMAGSSYIRTTDLFDLARP